MSLIQNPILHGFNPDPSILRVGDDYYIATSTFEWFPGVQIFHSRDLVNWRLINRPLTRVSQLDLRGVDNSRGVWAPCLSYQDGLFYLIYTDVKTMLPFTMDSHNYLVTAPDITGPWSEPIYLHSIGFDPSMFHDDDGRQWLVAMMTDHRPGRSCFGGIILQEYSAEKQQLIGEMYPIFAGAIGATEGPHVYKRDGWYYLMVAEGGTGLEHAVNVARSRELTGTYTADPDGPMISTRFLRDHYLLCSGHGSLVETPDGQWWCAHLCVRNTCTTPARAQLGRESAIQPVIWNSAGWPRLPHGHCAPLVTVEGPKLPAHPWPEEPARDDFEGTELRSEWQSLRVPIEENWVSLSARPGYLRLRGRDSLASHFEQSLVARRLEHPLATITTCVEFQPTHFKHMAGLIFIYDSNNWSYLHLRGEERLGRELVLTHRRKGRDREELVWTHAVSLYPKCWMRLEIAETTAHFYVSHDGELWSRVGEGFAPSEITSDGFTGPFIGLCCQDLVNRQIHADFDFFIYEPMLAESAQSQS